MAARTPVTVNNRGANEKGENVHKSKQGRYTFRGSKRDFQLKFGVTLPAQTNKPSVNLYPIVA